MRDIAVIRSSSNTILAIGDYRPGYQAILDFDFFNHTPVPSIVGIVTASSKTQKYFFGTKEVVIPCFSTVGEAREKLGSVDWLLNISSGRRAQRSTEQFFEEFPGAFGCHIFAEDVPEADALALAKSYPEKTIVGPAGVGLLVPGALKLGAIGGVDWRQLAKNDLSTAGSVAVLSASGGMVNEIISMVSSTGHRLSWALCFGGDRFPTLTPSDAFLAAEADPKTETIVYYGELGGQDEYELAKLLKTKQVTKPVVCYIAGVIGENFEQPVQFGHAKALANTLAETASAKRTVLAAAGATVATSMHDFAARIKKIPVDAKTKSEYPDLSQRQPTRFTSTISSEQPDGYAFVGKLLQTWAVEGSFPKQIITGLLGHAPKSEMTVEFVNTICLLSVDHGPQVSGALNTIVTARAGKSLVDALAAGLLTVGPRFGGAVSDAATEWYTGVSEGLDPKKHVEAYAAQKKYIGGIGHKKYRLGLPDPRVEMLSQFAERLPLHRYYDYARSIEAITSAKKGTLILNVDGTIAALMLDILENEEGYGPERLKELVTIDFFNALFVIPRIVGFASHYLDQRRMDEGLFRLPDEDVLLIPPQ